MKQVEESECPFCRAEVAGSTGRLAYSMPDDSPATPGHTLIVLARHESNLVNANIEEWQAVWALAREKAVALLGQPGVDGMNIGVNIGVSAGQTVSHAHVHLIPRTTGDSADPRGGVRRILEPAPAPPSRLAPVAWGIEQGTQ